MHEEGFPNSIGLFAALMTQYLGFRSNHGEYKVMGLSAFGKPDVDLSFLLQVTSDGYQLNERYLHQEVLNKYPAFPTEQLPIFNDRVSEHLPPPRKRDMPLAPWPWPRYISTLCRCDEPLGPFRVMSTW